MGVLTTESDASGRYLEGETLTRVVEGLRDLAASLERGEQRVYEVDVKHDVRSLDLGTGVMHHQLSGTRTLSLRLAPSR